MRSISRSSHRTTYSELDEAMSQVSPVTGIYLCVEYTCVQTLLFGYSIYTSANLFSRLMSAGGDEIIFYKMVRNKSILSKV